MPKVSHKMTISWKNWSTLTTKNCTGLNMKYFILSHLTFLGTVLGLQILKLRLENANSALDVIRTSSYIGWLYNYGRKFWRLVILYKCLTYGCVVSRHFFLACTCLRITALPAHKVAATAGELLGFFFPKKLSANTHDVSNTICYTYITPLCHIGCKKVSSST